MMKRMRAIDVPKTHLVYKFGRRTVKNRTRLGESVYLNASHLVYLKLVTVWLTCIALDLVVGFRFELLWPVWLMVRHLYESFRVQTFSSSLHYSAFSVFFVCITATSDLICYLFIPVQVLLFVASTYVWLQFVYQTNDRGLCFPTLAIWVLCIVFEYSFRYKFDHPTWYLARGPWFTAGLFPSTSDGPLAAASINSTALVQPHLEVYRPFAAHCLGYPIVTLGFRIKSLFSSWRLKRRREEVSNKNEFYDRLLAEALPSIYERRKSFGASRHHLALETETIGDYEIGSSWAVELDQRAFSNPTTLSVTANGNTTTNNTQPPLAISYGPGPTQCINRKSSTNKSGKVGKQQPVQNGLPRRTGTRSSGSGGPPLYYMPRAGLLRGDSGAYLANEQNGNSEDASIEDDLDSSRAPILTYISKVLFAWLPKFLASAVMYILSFIHTSLVSSISSLIQLTLSVFPPSSSSANNVQDDLISTSGDGSQLADEDSDQEEIFANNKPPVENGAKKKHQPQSRGRLRGRTPASASNPDDHTSSLLTAESNEFHENGLIQTKDNIVWKSNQNGHPTTILANGGDYGQKYANYNGKNSDDFSNNNNNNTNKENNNSHFAADEYKQLNKEKEVLEQSLSRLKTDLKSSKFHETELRTQLSTSQQQEKSAKQELSLLRAKYDQIEAKYKQISKQNEQQKSTMTLLEKRLAEVQTRKNELEKELSSEKNYTKVIKDDPTNKIGNTEMDLLKTKIVRLESEIKRLKNEIKNKDEFYANMERELVELQEHRKKCDLEIMKVHMLSLKDKNARLEQTLSSENRLKQDLFRALNDSKAQIETLQARLRERGGNDSPINKNGDLSQHSPSDSPPAPGMLGSFTPKSITPPLSTSSKLDLDQLINATGAQYMSYSFGHSTSNINGGETMFDASETSPAEMLLLSGTSSRVSPSTFATLVNSTQTNSSSK